MKKIIKLLIITFILSVIITSCRSHKTCPTYMQYNISNNNC